MSLTVLKSRPQEIHEDCIAALEEMLKVAREKGIDHLVIVGLEGRTRITQRLRVQALDVTLIGALSVLLQEMQQDYANAPEQHLPSLPV